MVLDTLEGTWKIKEIEKQEKWEREQRQRQKDRKRVTRFIPSKYFVRRSYSVFVTGCIDG